MTDLYIHAAECYNTRCPHGVKHNKEETMEKEYVVIKNFTLADFVNTHKAEYKWDSFADSCAEFQNDVNYWMKDNIFEWGTDVSDKSYTRNHLLGYDSKYSPQFIPHLIKYGFIKEKEPEVFYKVGDRFICHNTLWKDQECVIIDIYGECGLVNMKSWEIWTDPIKVRHGDKITQKELKLMSGCIGAFTKI